MYFVYYNDDLADEGGIGLEQFDAAYKAEEFIRGRMEQSESRTIKDYTVIDGKKMEIEIVKVVEDFRIR